MPDHCKPDDVLQRWNSMKKHTHHGAHPTKNRRNQGRTKPLLHPTSKYIQQNYVKKTHKEVVTRCVLILWIMYRTVSWKCMQNYLTMQQTFHLTPSCPNHQCQGTEELWRKTVLPLVELMYHTCLIPPPKLPQWRSFDNTWYSWISCPHPL